MAHPDSYNTFTLPTIQFSHHPPTSQAVTPVVVVKLHRPNDRNGFTEQMADSLIAAFDLLSSDKRVKAIVLTSSDPSNKMFCAGMDFNSLGDFEGPGLPPLADDHRDSGGRTSLALYRCNKPVIAAINGSAVGVGITMTLPANIRVVSSEAKVGFVFSRRGFVLEACSSFFLPRLVGTSKAMHLATTGSVYPATHKLFDGLFSEIVPPAEVLPTALKIADEIAANTSLISTKVNKDLIYRSPATPEEVHLLESKLFHVLVRREDVNEGISSFLQKKTPEFQGSLNDGMEQYPWWNAVDVRRPTKPKL